MNRRKPLERNTELKRTGFKPRAEGLRRTGFKSDPGSGLRCTATTKAPRYTGPKKKMRDAVLLRDDYTCQRCGRDIRDQPYSLQHLLPRGRGGKNTMRNLVTVCGSATTPGMCHDFIENQERRRATWEEGWLVPNGIAAETWPVLRFGTTWSRPADSWTQCAPHPMQVRAA